ncbi:ammonium transporter [Veillonella sp.]|uniref:ammonium transporter n=1 Tax=Veillonella sp. TaxID=1926307 RepID=UPI0025DA1D54|nr:ammonium transporter [Veillonella sp.]
MNYTKLLWALLVSACITSPALAADPSATIDTGNTTWVLVSAALVFFMTPGLAFFYGGMVRSKNVLSTIMQSFFMIALISVEWLLIGYSLVFSGDVNGLIGNLDKLGLAQVANSLMADVNIPEFAFVAFQCMFAVITPALISGAFAERIKFGGFVIFILLWSLCVYNPMAHWVWGGGFLAQLGALDFAGGLVIHILSGVSGLTLCLLMGPRKGYGKSPMLPHHLPMTVLGASLLWFGWFGFNAGSALGAGELAANAFIVTQMAAATATVAWVVCEWILQGKPTILGAASGCIAGLVAITPAAGFVNVLASFLIGLGGGVICYFAVAFLKNKLGYDDSLDAFGIHGIGGTWGAIATGIWATTEVNVAGANGLYYGNADLLLAQIVSVLVAFSLAIVGTLILYKIVTAFTPLRATVAEETTGLDITEHGESAYNVSIFSSNALSPSLNEATLLDAETTTMKTAHPSA